MRSPPLSAALLCSALAFAAAPNPVLAQQAPMDHGAMGHGTMDHATEDASDATSTEGASQELVDANMRMHEAMEIEMTGDADVDFVRAMIAHHVGAIDMAEIVLRHGEDAEIRALAEEIVATQDREIGVMRDWLERNGQSED